MKKTFLLAGLCLGIFSALSAQCMTLPNCPAAPQSVCDSSANDAQFWSDPFWNDPLNGGHDLAEAPVDLSMQVMENCGELQVSFLLLLDLNGNNSLESAVYSPHLPGPDTIYYSNAFNSNYLGGTPHHFDQRPVPLSQKYRFVLEQTVEGNLVTARVRWATTAAPDNYVLPELPMGTHRIEWTFRENDEIKTCGYDFTIGDCVAPTVTCQNGLAVNILPTLLVQLSASDFLQSGQDNITPANQLTYAIRRFGSGSGFPVNGQGQPITKVLFDCADLGAQGVELWVKDKAGNTGACTTAVVVQDNNGYCQSNTGIYKTCVYSSCSNFTQGIPGVHFEISSSSPAVPPYSLPAPTQENGCLLFDLPFPITPNDRLIPEKNESPLNGVSTFDLVMMSRHINGIEPFTQNWQWVAADTDLNGIIDSGDLRHCRSLTLGLGNDSIVYPGLRFYPLNFVFPAGNPLALPIPNYITLDSATLVAPIEFAAVKTCDVNCNAILTGAAESISVEENIGQPVPNPTTEGVSIALLLPKPFTVTVEIVDLIGRVVYRLAAPYNAGEQRLDIPASAFPQAGVYLWRLQAGRTFRSGKIVKQ